MENFFSKAYADTLYVGSSYVDDEIVAALSIAAAFSSNASNLTSGTVPFARLPVGTTTLTVCAGDDPRLSDARTPLAHTQPASTITDFAEAVDDEVATLLQAGTDVTVTYNDAANTLTLGLGSNVPRLNAANTFTQTQTFSGTIIVGTGVSIVRNATGPTAETRAAGGLRVCNADGSALGPVACREVNIFSGANRTGILFDGGSGTRLLVASGGFIGFGSSGSDANTQDTSISRASAGVLQIGTTSNNALGSLNLTNLTASGSIRPGQFTVATLPSAAANTGRTVQVTDSSVDFPGNIGATVAGGGAFNVDVKSNGTNWRITG